MKKHIRYVLWAILLVFTFNSLQITTGILTKTTRADGAVDFNDIEQTIHSEYNARVAMDLLFDNGTHCFVGRGAFDKKFRTETNANDDGPWLTYGGVAMGSMFTSNGSNPADGENHDVDCNNVDNDSNLLLLLKAIGYSGLTDFMDDIYKCDADHCVIRKPDGSTLAVNTEDTNDTVVAWARERALNRARASASTHLNNRSTDLKGRFTDPIRYWYIRKVLYDSKCQGRLENDKAIVDKDSKGSDWYIDFGKDFALAYLVADKGLVERNQWVVFHGELDRDRGIEGLTDTANDGIKGETCGEIARSMDVRYANAYVRDWVLPRYVEVAGSAVAAKCNAKGPDVNPIINCYLEAGTAVVGSVNGTPSSGPGGSANDVDPCEATGATIAWILCGAIHMVDSVTSWFGDQLTKLLKFELPSDSATNTNSAGHPLYESWTKFRGIANTLLIIIFLIIIISQMASIETLSAYTVKKAIPRLIIAAIVVQLSWYITIWVVGFVQAIGEVSKDLILAPFKSSLQNISFTGLQTGGVGIAGFVAGAASGIGIWGAIGTILIGALFAAFAAFAVVLVRRLVIIACIVMAPLAFIAWILPNTQGMFKLWWGFLTKTLLMYPIIVMLLVSGRIASSLMLSGVGGTAHAGLSFTNIFTHWSTAPWQNLGAYDPPVFIKLAAVAVYFAPYALIPLTFKFAGGLISNVGGMVNDKSRGILDNRRKRNSEGNAMRRQANASGTRFAEGNHSYAAKAFNRVSGGLGTGVRGGLGMSSRGRQQLAMNRAAFQEGKLQDAKWVMAARRDDIARAGTYASRQQAEKGLTEFYANERDAGGNFKLEHDAGGNITAAGLKAATDKAVKTSHEAAGTVGFKSQQAAFKQMLANGTAFTDADDVADVMDRVSGGDKATRDHLMGYNKANQKQAMRHELSGAGDDLLDARHELNKIKRTKGVNSPEYAKQREAVTRLTHKAHLEGAKSLDSYTIGKLKGSSARNLGDSSNAVLKEAKDSGVTTDDTRIAAAVLQDLNAASGQGTLQSALDAERARGGLEEIRTEPAAGPGSTEVVDKTVLDVQGLRIDRRPLDPARIEDINQQQNEQNKTK